MALLKKLIVFSVCLLTADAFSRQLAGGWGGWKDATEEVQRIANSVRDVAERMEWGSFEIFDAAKFKRQVVAGLNYIIRMDVGKETYLEIVVYKHWSGRTSLSSAYITDELISPPLIIEECPHNQEFLDCGTACPLICGEPEPFICTIQCVIGCQCPINMWQKDDGSCVDTKEECFDVVKECPENQEFNECGTACPKICGKPEPIFCTMQCEIGCQCPSGWWEKEDGSCVEHEKECDSFDPECQDNHDSCDHWASIGECCQNPSYMLSNCAKACGQCGDKEDRSCKCEDKNEQCSEWAAAGECCENEDYMLENCKESCSQCGKVNEVPGCPCMNYDANCEDWAEAGECESNPGFMNKSCPEACGTCEIKLMTCESHPCPEGCDCFDENGDHTCICPIIEPIIEPYIEPEPIVDPIPVWGDEE